MLPTLPTITEIPIQQIKFITNFSITLYIVDIQPDGSLGKITKVSTIDINRIYNVSIVLSVIVFFISIDKLLILFISIVETLVIFPS